MGVGGYIMYQKLEEGFLVDVLVPFHDDQLEMIPMRINGIDTSFGDEGSIIFEVEGGNVNYRTEIQVDLKKLEAGTVQAAVQDVIDMAHPSKCVYHHSLLLLPKEFCQELWECVSENCFPEDSE